MCDFWFLKVYRLFLQLNFNGMAVFELQSCSDQELVFLLKKGDIRALEAIYDRYWFPLYRRAYNLINDEEGAKDVVQELMIALWDNIKAREIDDLKAYLFQALKYQAFMLLRKRYTRQQHLDRMRELLETVDLTTEQTVDLREAETLVQKAVKTLPERCREVFELSRYQHLSDQQIAEKMQISIKTVENQKTKALKLMKKVLKDFMVILLLMGDF